VYDSLQGGVFLEALICDGCLVRKKGLMEEVRLTQPRPVAKRSPPDL
jgi:hypothetical protein